MGQALILMWQFSISWISWIHWWRLEYYLNCDLCEKEESQQECTNHRSAINLYLVAYKKSHTRILAIIIIMASFGSSTPEETSFLDLSMESQWNTILLEKWHQLGSLPEPWTLCIPDEIFRERVAAAMQVLGRFPQTLREVEEAERRAGKHKADEDSDGGSAEKKVKVERWENNSQPLWLSHKTTQRLF